MMLLLRGGTHVEPVAKAGAWAQGTPTLCVMTWLMSASAPAMKSTPEPSR